MPERRKKERRKSVRDLFELHSQEDQKNFRSIAETLVRIEGHIETSNKFMASLEWLSNISTASELLKKPSLWIVGFVIAAVALLGGVKALFAAALSYFIPK